MNTGKALWQSQDCTGGFSAVSVYCFQAPDVSLLKIIYTDPYSCLRSV